MFVGFIGGGFIVGWAFERATNQLVFKLLVRLARTEKPRKEILDLLFSEQLLTSSTHEELVQLIEARARENENGH